MAKPSPRPSPFRTPSDCGTANNPSRLQIDADDIRFHESSGTITAVTVSEESDITGMVRHRCD